MGICLRTSRWPYTFWVIAPIGKMMQTQLGLFEDTVLVEGDRLRISRSGTFVDNMVLPVHRWFRYSAGFSAEWVEELLQAWNIGSRHTILDPFAGSGTVSVVCDTQSIRSYSVEAHPVVARICKTKLLWTTPSWRLTEFADAVMERSKKESGDLSSYPDLIQRSYEKNALTVLDNLKTAWQHLDDGSPESELVWLAITAILRPTAKAGTAQWQYILPNKTKKKVASPIIAFDQQVRVMKSDIESMQMTSNESRAVVVSGDARDLKMAIIDGIDAVITSPPYANNYDYADALRFEMTFWGDVAGWYDIHDKVRKYLIVSSSQHSSREKLRLDDLLASSAVSPIRHELTEVTTTLARVRENYGGKKHYHTMLAAYCRDISLVMQQLRQVCNGGAHMCWVIGDSAPYGVYSPIERWIGELALAAGFREYRFEKLRDRNTKWKNRKHRVPLKEGLLWIEG